MRIDDPDPLDRITPIKRTPETAGLGDKRKSPQEHREGAEEAGDQESLSFKWAGAAEIDLSGIARENAGKLLAHPAFTGWETPVTGPVPAALTRLERALQEAQAGTLAPDDHIFLESAGTLIATAAADAAGRINPSHAESLEQLRAEAQEIAAKTARGGDLAK